MTKPEDWRMNLKNGDEFQIRGDGKVYTVSSVEYTLCEKGADHVVRIETNDGEFIECFVYDIS